ncbi:RagB/SusD family nutrient uptake outer membrane protein [Flagellimonas hymeniacidonis]|uniref:RagB/SusD family nutrient uptake outer membrane protein n=1 Tax=Flagellimonas hymeniacidonis TaxID=2603628 RepID=UPI00164FC104|nr:RagB/SusD family nutrient uptake outer membrane protein [Flagellimonas hymeniacidonis]
MEDLYVQFGPQYNEFPHIGYVKEGVFSVKGLSVPKSFLTRAECRARRGDIAGAMADLEMVRVNRFYTDMYRPLPIPANEKAAVEEIIDERRREFPYSLRWIDIRRLNNDPLTDPIIITRDFYEVANSIVNRDVITTYTLEPSDRRYARPIFDAVITNSQGQTEQNTY